MRKFNIFANIPKNLRYNFSQNVLMMIFNGLFLGCYSNFFGVIAREHFHAGAFWIAVVNASMTMSGIFGFFIAGFVSKGKEHIWCRYLRFFSSLCIITAGFIPNTYAKIFCILLGFLHLIACYGPLESTIYAYIYPIEHRIKLLGYVKMFQSITGMIVTLLVGLIINMTLMGIDVWRVIFVLGGIFFFLSGIPAGKMKINNIAEEKENPLTYIKQSLQIVVKEKFNIIFIISGILYTIGNVIFVTLFPIYQVDIMHINGREVSLIAVVGSIGNIVAYPFLGNFYNKINPLKAWLWAFPLMIIYPLIFVIAGINWYLLLPGILFWSMFVVTGDICWINLIIYFGGREKIKEYQGLYAFVMAIRSIIGLFVASYIIEKCEKLHFDLMINYRICFFIGIGFIFLAFLAYLPILKKLKK